MGSALDALSQKRARAKDLGEIVCAAAAAAAARDAEYMAAIAAETNRVLARLPAPPAAYGGDQFVLGAELGRARDVLRQLLDAAKALGEVEKEGTEKEGAAHTAPTAARTPPPRALPPRALRPAASRP